MRKVAVVGSVLAVVLLVGALVLSGVAMAQQQGTPTPTPPTAASPVAWIGISLADLNSGVASRLGISQTQGVAIVQVVPNSPAAGAGLLAKDVITAVDGKAVTASADVMVAVKAKRIGDTVSITVFRAGQSSQVNVVTAQAPTNAGRAAGTPNAGKSGNGLGSPGLSGFRGAMPLGILPNALQGLTPGDLFGRLLGWQFSYKDNNGNTVTLRSIPGTVVTASKDSITIKPNDTSNSGGPYAITADTKVTLAVNATVDTLKAGDQVVVVTSDGKTALSVSSASGGRGSMTGGAAPTTPAPGQKQGRGFGGRGMMPNRPNQKPTPGTSS